MAAVQQPMQTAPQNDLDGWVAKASNALKDPTPITNPTGTASWSSGFFECFQPIDTCAITCCCPCITFGKTHHRLNKDPSLAGYSVVNTSCLGWWVVACCGFHCIPNILQRHDIRTKASPNLEGNFVTDFLKSWCCSCCDLIQQDKEAEHLMATQGAAVVMQPEIKTETMSYAPQ